MAKAAYVEHRPHPASENAETTHFVVIVDDAQVGENFETQKEAKEYACKKGYEPVHVARVRHLQNRKNPDHWRKDPC